MNREMRNPTLANAQEVLALMIRCDVAAYGEPDSDLEDLTFEWEQIDLAHDAWLVHAEDGRLLGYGAVLPWGDDLRLDFYSEPEWPGDALGGDLLARCLARAREKAADRSTGLVARTFVAHSNGRGLALAREARMLPGRFIFQMAIDLDRRPPAPEWPVGVKVRTAAPGQDDRAVHQLIQSAFHQPGRTPQTFSDWCDVMTRPDIFDPELWFLALAGEEIIGACLAFAYPSGGWVRQLAVAESWRGQGLGKALLRAAFDAFFARGYQRVGLTVESRRPDAFAFYRAAGMRQLRQYDEFMLGLGLA
jgi:mycothiol synthase